MITEEWLAKKKFSFVGIRNIWKSFSRLLKPKISFLDVFMDGRKVKRIGERALEKVLASTNKFILDTQ